MNSLSCRRFPNSMGRIETGRRFRPSTPRSAVRPGSQRAHHDLAERLGSEEPWDIRHLHGRAEAVGRDLAEELPQVLQAGLGQVAFLLESRLREGPPRVLHDLAARDLDLEGPFEVENDV